MAKELPYFKFEPSEWENGNIQICSREDKGLFIDLCGLYWSRIGDVPLKLAIQKLCGGNATAFDSLLENKIFRVIDGLIYIEFLDEQLQEFENVRNTNKENALKGWEKRRKIKDESDRNATALNSQCENDAIREDKIREEEKREEKKKKEINIIDIDIRKNDFANTLRPFLNIYGKDILNEFFEYWTEPTQSKNPKMKFELQKTWSISRRLKTWNNYESKFKNNGTKPLNQEERINETMRRYMEYSERKNDF